MSDVVERGRRMRPLAKFEGGRGLAREACRGSP